MMTMDAALPETNEKIRAAFLDKLGKNARVVRPSRISKQPSIGADLGGQVATSCESPTSDPTAVPVPHARRFPIDVFPPKIARFARQVAEAMQCPVDIPGLAILVVAATAIGAARALKVKDGWEEMPSLYAAVVASPGQAKSPAIREVLRPLFNEQERVQREFDAALKAALAEDADAPPPLPMRHVFTTNSTTEALAEMLLFSPKGILVCPEELSGLVRSMNLYRGGRGGDLQFYLSAWSGEPLKIDRKSRRGQPFFLRNPFICVLGGIQPEVLQELEFKEGREDGFIDRILFACCAAGPFPSWSDQAISEETRGEWEKVVQTLMFLEPAFSVGSSPRPQVVSLDAIGQQILIEFFKDLAGRVNKGNVSPSMAGVCTKMRSYLPRIALVIHLLREAADGWAGGVMVDGDDVERAVRLCDYFIDHAAIAHQQLRQGPVDNKVKKFAEWMRRKGLAECTARDVMRANAVGITAKSDAEELMDAAVDRGVGEWQTPVDKGKRARRFVLNPANAADHSNQEPVNS